MLKVLWLRHTAPWWLGPMQWFSENSFQEGMPDIDMLFAQVYTNKLHIIAWSG